MIERVVKIRKKRKCSLCHETHQIGAKMHYVEDRGPAYGDIETVGGIAYEKQTGIKYYKDWYCYDSGLGMTIPPCT